MVIGIFVMLVVFAIPLVIYYIGHKDDQNIDWVRLRTNFFKYGPVVISYIVLTSFLYNREIIDYNSVGLLFSFAPFILIAMGLRKIIARGYENVSTGVVLLVIGLVFAGLSVGEIARNSNEGFLQGVFEYFSILFQLFGQLLFILFFPLVIVGVLFSYLFRNRN